MCLSECEWEDGEGHSAGMEQVSERVQHEDKLTTHPLG